MKTAIFSLVIALAVAVISLFQFEKYQRFALSAQQLQTKLEKEVNTKLEEVQQKLDQEKQQKNRLLRETESPVWKMAEIEYLLTTANARITSREIQMTIRLLSMAQEKLETLNDPKLTPLYQAVVQDRESLLHFQLPNIEALWLKVGTLIEQAGKLTPRGVVLDEKMPALPETSLDNTQNVTWKQKLTNTLSEIKDLIKIHHYSKPVEPLISETARSLILLNLRSLLEQMRFALLAQEQVIYLQSIENLKQWLMAYYDETQPNVQSIITALTELSSVTLHPELPGLSSLEWLNLLR